jgi:hypothetical protein
VTAQPIHPHDVDAPRVPRTINGIADALTGARRMEFYREIGQAEAGPALEHALATWWGEAMLDTDPERDDIIAAAEADTLPTVTMEEVFRRRHAAGGATPRE